MQIPQRSKGWLRKVGRAAGRIWRSGPTCLPEAIPICRSLIDHGIPVTLGKMSISGDDPGALAAEHRSAADLLAPVSGRGRFYLSIKPPALRFNFRHVEAVAAAMFGRKHGLHFDSHGYDQADATVVLLSRVMARFGALPGMEARMRYGLSLPSRWKRSLRDAEWAARAGVRPRLVKGEFRAPHKEEMEPRAGFLELVARLAGRVPEMALATHDLELASAAVDAARRTGTRVELELLFGMPVTGMIALSGKLGVPVRFYIPYGELLLLFGLRDIITNPHKLLRPSPGELLLDYRAKMKRILTQIDGCGLPAVDGADSGLF